MSNKLDYRVRHETIISRAHKKLSFSNRHSAIIAELHCLSTYRLYDLYMVLVLFYSVLFWPAEQNKHQNTNWDTKTSYILKY